MIGLGVCNVYFTLVFPTRTILGVVSCWPRPSCTDHHFGANFGIKGAPVQGTTSITPPIEYLIIEYLSAPDPVSASQREVGALDMHSDSLRLQRYAMRH